MSSHTIGDLCRRLEEETGKLTFLDRLWQYPTTFLKKALNTLAHFVIQDATFELIPTLSPILSTNSPHFRDAKLELLDD